MLGGGQLGRMFVTAARTMGYLADELPVVDSFDPFQLDAFRLLMFADYVCRCLTISDIRRCLR